MAEVQKQSSIPAGELTQRFMQFVMMQTQNVLFLLGKMATPDGRTAPPNLDAAKMMIDQLEMIREKTRNNLTAQESSLLEEALTELRLSFVEASGGTPHSMMPDRSPSIKIPEPQNDEKPSSSSSPPADSASRASTSPKGSPVEENKKKFVKSYG